MYLITENEKLPDEVTKKLEQQRNKMVDALQQHAKGEGLLLFEGQWLTAEQVDLAYQKLQRRSWFILCEVAIIFTAMVIATVFAGYILIALARLG